MKLERAPQTANVQSAIQLLELVYSAGSRTAGWCSHLQILDQGAGQCWDVHMLVLQGVHQPHNTLSRHGQQPVMAGLHT